MPRYTNTTNALIVSGSLRLDPYQSVDTNEWLAVIPAGVTKAADLPFYNPIIYSIKVTGTATYAIPATVIGNYKIRLVCTGAEVSIKFNSTTAVNKVMAANEVYEVMCLSRTVDSVIMTIAGGTVYLTVEKI